MKTRRILLACSVIAGVAILLAQGGPSSSNYPTTGGSMTWPAAAGITVCTGTPCTAWGTSLTAPAGTILGTTDTQVVTNKDLTGAGNTFASASPITAGTAAGSPGYVDKTIGYLTSNMAVQSSATLLNVTNMTWTVATGKNYVLSCDMPVLFVASAQIQWALNGPSIIYSMSVWGITTSVTASVQEDVIAQTSGTATALFTSPGAVTRIFHIKAGIRASGSGSLTLQTAGNGTNNIQVLTDTACTLTQAN